MLRRSNIIFSATEAGKSKVNIRVATLMQKQNSPTFYWLFPDQIQFFTDWNTAVLRPICLLAADKLQILFTSSLKYTSLIFQMKQIKSLNSFSAQNVLKLTSFHSFERAREKINTFKKNQHFFRISSSQSTCYNTYFGPKLWNSLTFPWLSWYLKFPWPISKFPVVKVPATTHTLGQNYEILRRSRAAFRWSDLAEILS